MISYSDCNNVISVIMTLFREAVYNDVELNQSRMPSVNKANRRSEVPLLSKGGVSYVGGR